jgi:hypothetical protein
MLNLISNCRSTNDKHKVILSHYVRMSKMKNNDTMLVYWYEKKPVQSHIAGGNFKWYSQSGKQFDSFHEKVNIHIRSVQQSYPWACIPEKWKFIFCS